MNEPQMPQEQWGMPGLWGMPGPMMQQQPWNPYGSMMGYPYYVQLLNMIQNAMPTFELAHSWHAQALNIPEVKALPAMQRFTDLSIHSLHDMVAAAGFLRRLIMGDQSQDVMAGLRQQLIKAMREHGDAKAQLTHIMQTDVARRSDVMRYFAQMMADADQSMQELNSAAQPLLAQTQAR